MLATHGMALPALPSLLAGIGIGIITGIGSICYCLALGYLAVSVVVAFANLYIVVTVLLGMTVLHEAATPLKITSLLVTLAGVLVLSYSPGRHGVQLGEGAATQTHWLRPLVILAAYILLIGTGTFLEKPALHGLDATQLNALQAAGMVGGGVCCLDRSR
jgi:drug/metabolite transporter (DMT)-like permease